MSTRREYETLFKLNAELGTGYSKAFAQAQKEVAEMQEEIVLLNKYQKDISAYEKQQKAISNTAQNLELYKKQLENLKDAQAALTKKAKEHEAQLAEMNEEERRNASQMAEYEKQNADLKNAILAKTRQVEKATDSLKAHEAAAERTAQALKEAGVNTDALADETARLAQESAQLKERQQAVAKSAQELGTSGAESMQAFADSMIADKALEAMREAYEIITACTEASIEFESAITGVYKTVDGTDEQLAGISSEVRQMALVIPATVDEIAAVAEAAGQLGIATEDVTEFTSVMINLGESTNLSAEDAAESLAKFSNITGTAAGNYGRLGSVIVDLGNNFATTERDIVAMATRLASSGTIAGLTEPEILALAAAMSSVGIEAEAGGTAMTQTLGAIEAEVAAGGEGLAEFARIAGMTADDFASTWERAPIEALTTFIGGLGELEAKGENATLVLDGLGLSGVRQSNMLKALSLAADTLTGTVETANRAWIENNALTEEAAKRYATTASQQQMAANAANNLKIAVGDALTPALRTLYGVEIDVLGGMAEIVEENPALVRGVTATAGVMGVGTAATLGYVAATKLAQSAAALLGGTIPYLGPVMATVGIASAALGVTTAALTAEFDKEAAAIRRLSEEERQEYISALEAQNAAAQELLQTNRESVEQTDVSLDRVLALTGRLSELKEANDGAIASQEEMKAITAELNGMFPELAGSYDGTVGSVDAYVEAVEAAARAEAERQRYEGARKGMVDANITKATAEAARDDALIKQAEARERLNKAEVAYNAIRKGVGSDQGGQMALQLSTEYKELVAAQEAWQEYSAQVAESQDVLNQAAADLDYYRSIVEAYAEGIYGTGEATDSATGAINNAVGAINALAESYGLAYNAAYESIAGQFALWDEAERVTATSADTMAENIQSQIEYWQEYNKNIDILLGKSASIEGLSDLIGSFADGSPESVAAIAGLAAASDEDLAAMVADWQLLKAEHKTASSSLADLVVDFTGQMDELTAAVGEDIAAMNLSEEAREAARATMQAYLDGVTGMLPEVETAFSAFGGSVLGMLTPSAGAQPENGYASGTHYAHPGWRLVGENGPELAYFGGGEAVLNAQDTAAALAPGSDTVVNLNVELNVAGDVHDPDRLLEDAGQDFERRVRAVLEDVAEQRLRRSYI